MDDLIEKYREINDKLYQYCSLILLDKTRDKELTNFGDAEYFKILPSGIKPFVGEKTYLDTSSVQNDAIIDETYKIKYDKRPSRANMQPVPNSVWFAKMKDSPKFIILKDQPKDILSNFIFSTGYAGLTSDRKSINYIYALVLSDSFQKQKNANANGSTMQAINNNSLAKIQVPNLSTKETQSIGELLDPFVDTIIKNLSSIRILNRIKDLLLHKYFD